MNDYEDEAQAAFAQKAMFDWQMDTLAPPLMMLYRDLTPLKRAGVIAQSIQTEILPNGFTESTKELRYACHKRTLEVALDLYNRRDQALPTSDLPGEQ